MLHPEQFHSVRGLDAENAEGSQSHADDDDRSHHPRITSLEQGERGERVRDQKGAEHPVGDTAPEPVGEPARQGDDREPQHRRDHHRGGGDRLRHLKGFDDVPDKERLRDVRGAVLPDPQAEHDEERLPAALLRVETTPADRLLLFGLLLLERAEHGALLHRAPQEDGEERDEHRDQEGDPPAPHHEVVLGDHQH